MYNLSNHNELQIKWTCHDWFGKDHKVLEYKTLKRMWGNANTDFSGGSVRAIFLGTTYETVKS